MQRRLASRIGFGVLGVALGILVSNGSLLLVGQNPPSRLKLPNIPQAPVSYPGIPVRQAQGVPAMRPTRAGVVPAFSADELQRFLTSNSVPLGIKGTPYSINRVDCSLTAGKVSTILHGKALAIPADTPVCYAELKGEFTFPLPAPRRSARPTTIAFHKGFRIYDLKTGNIMASGAFD